MRRRALAVAATAAALFCISADLGACGDKFLRIGRSARLRGYAAIHPASILVYRKSTSTDKDVKDFEKQLKKAGHKPLIIAHGSSIAAALARGKFDLILADYDDRYTVNDQLKSVVGGPDLLPFLYKPSKTVAAQAASEYHCVITQDEMTLYDALEEIDHAMDMRLKEPTASSVRK